MALQASPAAIKSTLKCQETPLIYSWYLFYFHVVLLNYCAICGDRVKIFIGNYSVLVCAVLKISADSKVYISVSVIRKKQSF